MVGGGLHISTSHPGDLMVATNTAHGLYEIQYSWLWWHSILLAYHSLQHYVAMLLLLWWL